jgi:FtsH-binding integral membrane protein
MVTAVPAPRRRSLLRFAAGVILLLLGIVGFVAVVAFLGLNVFLHMDGGKVPDSESRPILLAALFSGVYGLAAVLGGVGVLLGREWGRAIGLIVALVGGVMLLWGVVTGPDPNRLGTTVIFAVVHAYVAIVLLTRWNPRARV